MNNLPQNWTICHLEDVVEILDSSRIPLNASERERRIAGKTPDELYPYYGATGLAGYVDDYLFEEPLILLGEDGVPFYDPLSRKAHIVSGKYWVNNHAHVLKPYSTFIDIRYICEFLNYFDYEGFISGSTRLKLTQTAMRKIPIPLAPTKEQERISDKLDILLARIVTCQKRLDRVQFILERFRQSVLAAAISGELTKDWRDNEGISLDSWLVKSGDEIFPYITSGSRGWAKYYSDSGSIFLRVGNLIHDSIKVDLNDVQHVNLPPDVEGKRTRIEIGDILISVTADVGRVALIAEDIGESYINQHLCLARQSGEFSGFYLAYYLASPLGGRGQLTNMQRGVTKAGVTLGNIKELVFKIPKRAEQDEIVRRIEAFFTFADNVEAHCKTALNRVEHLIPTILDKAFRGELVPQDPKDEPSSKLLERIRLERAKQAEKPKKSRPPRPKRIKMTEETVIEMINQFSDNTFSFEDLRNSFPGDYEKLKEIVFSLLGESEPTITQVFQRSLKAMRFVREDK